ncbi:hypothetical protein HII36_16835 [Nonomuraea sp. NN258]|uniref:VanW family protein n=1 Tax=Nonomuraea antri TaxID=2730852 RepID=UPI00156985BC|nr:VanW family protein [Nonomuraea antri]NRQ33502.1 hypothetical protein [Nonomuraea antri]
MSDSNREPAPPPAPVFGRPAGRPEIAEPEPPRKRRLLPGLLVLVALLVVLAYAVPAVLMSGAVLRGTHVAGVDIGGLTVTKAAEKLRVELSAKLSQPVEVDLGGEKDIIQADEAGLELDVVATLNQAPSGFPTPIEVWRGLTGTTNLQPKITIDPAQLTRTVEGLAEGVDKPAVEGRITFDRLRPQVRMPADGVLLDRSDAVRQISEAFLSGRDAVVLALRPAKPTTTRESVAAAAAGARRAVAGPITLTIAGKQAQLAPATIAANLTYVPDGEGGLTPQFDAESALVGVENSLVDTAQQPQDATYQIVNGSPVLVPSRVGRGVDDKRLARDVIKLLAADGGRTIPVTLAAARPAVTTAEVRDLGIKESVAQFTTSFECCQPRVKNIQTMAQNIDGHLVKPGETFSLNDTLGERTVEGGYVEAGQIVGGRMVPIIGGGGAQFATALYNAVYAGGYEEVERTPMDYFDSRYPAGRDAALLHPDRDLKWRNDSEHGVLIKTAVTGTSVTVTLWSTKRYDKIVAVESDKRDFTPFRSERGTAPGCVATIGQQGFTIDVTRVFYNDGQVVKRDKKQTTEYRPRAQVTCG